MHEDRNLACYKPHHWILPSEPCRNAARRRPTILDEEGNLAWPAAAPGAAASAGNTAAGASAAELAAALAAVSEGSSSAGAAKRAARESAEAADADVFETEILAWGREVRSADLLPLASYPICHAACCWSLACCMFCSCDQAIWLAHMRVKLSSTAAKAPYGTGHARDDSLSEVLRTPSGLALMLNRLQTADAGRATQRDGQAHHRAEHSGASCFDTSTFVPRCGTSWTVRQPKASRTASPRDPILR